MNYYFCFFLLKKIKWNILNIVHGMVIDLVKLMYNVSFVKDLNIPSTTNLKKMRKSGKRFYMKNNHMMIITLMRHSYKV